MNKRKRKRSHWGAGKQQAVLAFISMVLAGNSEFESLERHALQLHKTLARKRKSKQHGQA